MPTNRAILTFAFALLALSGCSKNKHYPIDVDPHKRLVGRTFELTTDCYIFTWQNYKPPFPVFTAYPPAKGIGLPELPPKVTGTFIGQKFIESNDVVSEAYQIIGIIKKGTRFKTSRVFRLSPEDNRFDVYEVDIGDPYQPAFPKLDAFWITDPRSGKPQQPSDFAPEFAREIK